MKVGRARNPGRSSRWRRRGMFLADAMFGFAITAVLGLVLVAGITQARRSQVRLDEGAAATRIAQRALVELQAGRVVPKEFADAEVTVAPASGGATIAGQAWVTVNVKYHGRSASLVGLTAKGGVK
jgi:Na+-transporting NADH:ubiquinone oxidoreductase subunit NqrF